ncbi:MAG: c-type cytochrome domain-containing protein, partial [Planctomycetota bacterium]|nr:c-type cytochrome domain-containing protein [Planctomycetota bacterium]
MRNLFPHATAILLSVVAVVDANESTKNFLKENCIRCHGSQKQKADRRFDNLPNVIQNLTDLERYQEIVDQL